MVVWPLKKSIREHLPKIFLNSGYRKCRVIIDCEKVLVERPKSLFDQAALWSDYKHHNTFKYLVGIAPAGTITHLITWLELHPQGYFVPLFLLLRSSKWQITRDSGFYDLLERDDK